MCNSFCSHAHKNKTYAKLSLYLLTSLFQHLSSPHSQWDRACLLQNGRLWKVQGQSTDRMVMMIRMQHKRSWSIYLSDISFQLWQASDLFQWDWSIYFNFIYSYTFYLFVRIKYLQHSFWFTRLTNLGMHTVNFWAKMCILSNNYFLFTINQKQNILFYLNDTL